MFSIDQPLEELRIESQTHPQIVFCAERTGFIIHVNDFLQRYIGMNKREAMGFGWSQALHPEDRPRVLAAWIEAMQGGRQFEQRFRTISMLHSAYRWNYAIARPERDRLGNIYGWIGYGLDLDA